MTIVTKLTNKENINTRRDD